MENPRNFYSKNIKIMFIFIPTALSRLVAENSQCQLNNQLFSVSGKILSPISVMDFSRHAPSRRFRVPPGEYPAGTGF